MAWAKRRNRRYLYHSYREGGCVRKEYYGAGKGAELISQMLAVERDRRDAARADLLAEKEQLEEIDAVVGSFDDAVNREVFSALEAAGFRQHKRGEWRKRRGQDRQETR